MVSALVADTLSLRACLSLLQSGKYSGFALRQTSTLPFSDRSPVIARSIEAEMTGATAAGVSLADALAPSSSAEAAPNIGKADIRAADLVPKAKI